MMLATVAIAGIPPLAGFFSKDQILGAAFGAGHPILFAVGLFTAGMTAFYMFRLDADDVLRRASAGRRTARRTSTSRRRR